MEFILTVVIIIFLLGFLLRLLSPLLLKLFVKRLSKRFGQQGGDFYERQQNKQQRREGEVTIEQRDITEKKIDKNIGDYIDFEEEK